MNASMKRWISRLLVVCLIPLMTGCVSEQLWGGRFGSVHNQAAPEPNLSLSQTADGKDVLVQYDEERSKDAKIQRRAYLLHANEKDIATGKKPFFITAKRVQKMQLIPLTISYLTNVSKAGDLTWRAILQEDKHHFTLVSDGKEMGSYPLPNYRQPSTLVAIILGPPAVTVDVVLLVTIFVGPYVLQGLGNYK